LILSDHINDFTVMMRNLSVLVATVGAKSITLATFDGAEETTLEWAPVNDPVMGGQSKSTFSTQPPLGIFEGEVKVVTFLGSPGFCNLETRGALAFPDVSGTDGIVVDAKQTLDGGLKNFDVRVATAQSNAAKNGASWGANFEMESGKDSYFVPFSAFTCMWRGQTLSTCGNIADQLSSVTQLTVGSGGVAGPFRLELTSLSAASAPQLHAGGDVDLATFGLSDATQRTFKQSNDPVMGGKSTGTWTDNGSFGTMEGTCAIVPSLSAPGFINAKASASFADVSSCTGIELEVRSTSNPDPYTGYRFGFGNDQSSCGKFFARGYKADFSAPSGDAFGVVQIPFNKFTDCWSDATGEAITTCEADSTKCPKAKRLADLQTVAIWAEGVEGDVKIDVKSIKGYGCSAGALVV